MKKLLLILFILLFIVSCNSKKEEVVKVGYIGELDLSIWEYVSNEMKSKNITLELIQFSDYSVINKALNSGHIDLNHFQNYAYFVNATNKNDYYLSVIDKTFIASMNIYSKKLTNLSELKINSKIAIPKDSVNLSRSLKILESIGLLKLNKQNNINYNFTTNDIKENYLKLDFVAVEADDVYSVISLVDAAFVNLNLNFDFKDENIIYHDDPSKYDSDMYINLIAARLEDEDNTLYKNIAASYKNRIKEVVESGKLNGIIINY
ncbi:MetQ/NlpA family ABC transporter substrate-binding protein [Brachyspira hyodysenteriae]|uniref:MetQ/NlpA family ABC transporter substrate-binding protein n=1 Tax=Brachyspira hyodysenteriae TaxID=159 RepID=UPI0022CDA02A|nr:MetQ/NlpA family ABC transporter substrate-binding protein [Brachyspira hyodysenteriae]MCZ9838279.1 MetQ/NlpA family ABC transporter substrate-binding protein [Brachyspira hyodysenteriae]MCZ9849390.1 MetQ/NlpA family ABC transporter substrate-binding protein [Brachyspira hyodysenteriae]MCZ9850321.1 MetQ/NlpA family ABC transporter substrate-binding protein [Brachyspira hyodysenteriae]MCZ9860926.1 MetQ/NlpA family ABC transporter substrate-binding protein [Brachyspira hyodysenteriae]MCZ98708